MRAVRRALSVVLVAAACLATLSASTVRAQDAGSRWTVGGGAGVLLPQGAFGDHVDTAAMWEMFLVHQRREGGPWGGRLTFQFTSFAHSDTTFALPGVDAETRTSSDLILVTIGPQYTFGTGRTRGLLLASVGFAEASTRTAIRTTTNDVGNTNRSDGSVAWEMGGTLSIRLTRSELLSLELGGRWFATGKLSYVPEGGIRRQAGALVLSAREDALSGLVLRGALVAAIGRTRR